MTPSRPRSTVDAIPFVAVLLCLIAMILAVMVPVRVGAHRARTWAADQGYTVLELDHRWFAKGPFFFRSADHQNVYHVVLRRVDGTIEEGFLRTGGWFGGTLWSSTVTPALVPRPR